MTRCAGWIASLALATAIAATARAEDLASAYSQCFVRDSIRRIEGCTAVIESGQGSKEKLAEAHAMRGLAYSLTGDYAAAIKDYDVAIGMRPDYPVALNNRAWALFRSVKADEALLDVEKSLQLEPRAAYSLDTRAHIRQLKGDSEGALKDYTKAMYFGGRDMIKLYQCGLTGAGLYKGKIDGIWQRELQQGLEQCVRKTTCDPLPADELCPVT
jgi:tetratricopeptide (TPR) repeat protein